MKRIIAVLLALCLAVTGTVLAFAAETKVKVKSPYEVDFIFPDGYTPITKETVKANAELLDFLGISQDRMNQYFDQKGFLAFSISSDYREQIYVIAEQNDVSTAVKNLSELSDPTSVQNLLVGNVESEGAAVTLTEPIGGNVYFYIVKETAPKIEDSSSSVSSEGSSSAEATEDMQPQPDEKTEPCMVYYTTVVDSVAYVVCYSNESGRFSSEAELMLSSFVNSMNIGRGPADPEPEMTNNVQIIVNWVLIALAVGIIIYAAVTLIAEFRKRRLEEDFHEKSPKRPLR